MHFPPAYAELKLAGKITSCPLWFVVAIVTCTKHTRAIYFLRSSVAAIPLNGKTTAKINVAGISRVTP